jgi:isopentenyl-diphosphate delta-isomerase
MEQVILVDSKDKQIGVMEKLEAHQKGMLHRAFSVFIFNSEGEMLLQQRAAEKYHSPGLWTNACCSHPRPGEETLAAANRRLYEEMGIRSVLEFKTTFIYRSEFKNGLIEHELDHVFTGHANDGPKINREEVQDYKWLKLESIKNLIQNEPEKFTTWFRIAMEKVF